MRYLREREVRQVVGNIARSTLRRWENDGLFPKRRKLGPAAVGWISTEIETWLASRRPSETEKRSRPDNLERSNLRTRFGGKVGADAD